MAGEPSVRWATPDSSPASWGTVSYSAIMVVSSGAGECRKNGKTAAVEMRKIGRRLLIEEPCRRERESCVERENCVGGRERTMRESEPKTRRKEG